MKLIDRHAECGVLDGLLEAIHSGESRVLVFSGEPGVGKTALLEYLSQQRPGADWPGLRACSRRWNCRSPDYISCARRCSATSPTCHHRSGKRFGLHLA